MAHPDQQLVSRIIKTGELTKVIEWGITEEDFRTIEGKGWFTHLKGYFSSPDHLGALPGSGTFRNKFPAFDFCDDEHQTLEGLCTEVRKNRIIKDMEGSAQEMLNLLADDPLGAVGFMQERTQQLHTLGLKMNDMQFNNAVEELDLRYEAMANGVGYSELSWPWEAFNKATGGLQDDDYIILYGRPKSMKSFVLAKFAAHLYEECGEQHILAYTKEMPAWQLYRRIVGFIARLPYDEFRMGKLNPEQRQAFRNVKMMVNDETKRTNGRHNITAISGRDAPAGVDSIAWLRGKVEKYKPTVIFIDGLYLMSADRKVAKDEERVRQISRAARQLVLETRIPVIATMQATRGASKHENAELDEIAYSDAISQDTTCAIRVINEKLTPTVALVVAGSREFKLHGARIWGIPCTNFSYKEEMTEKEIEKAKEKDAVAEPEKPKAEKNGRSKEEKKHEDNSRRILQQQLNQL